MQIFFRLWRIRKCFGVLLELSEGFKINLFEFSGYHCTKLPEKTTSSVELHVFLPFWWDQLSAHSNVWQFVQSFRDERRIVSRCLPLNPNMDNPTSLVILKSYAYHIQIFHVLICPLNSKFPFFPKKCIHLVFLFLN